MRTHRWICFMLVLASLLHTGCAYRQPVRIGYAAQLTGPQSDLGVDGRDGAQLAVDALNAAGGIAGRSVELLVRDDKGDPEIARQVDAELVRLGAVAVVGHITSGQTAAVLDQMQGAEVVLFSPTASSDQFTGKDDHFFRVAPATSSQARAFARHLVATSVQDVVGVYDLGNRAFAETFWQHLAAEVHSLGGTVRGEVPFTSGVDDLQAVARRVAEVTPGAIVFVASALDTALLAQYSRQAGVAAPLLASGWAQSDELLAKGGAAVEGMQLAAVYHPDNPLPAFQAFLASFEARYQRRPAYAAAYSYDAILVLAEALGSTGGERAGLREALAGPREVTGTQGNLRLDQFGDIQRELYIATIRGGQFVITATMP